MAGRLPCMFTEAYFLILIGILNIHASQNAYQWASAPTSLCFTPSSAEQYDESFTIATFIFVPASEKYLIEYSTCLRHHLIEYALKHGITICVLTSIGGPIDSSRPASWSKIPYLRSLLPTTDYLMWIDADAVITNMDISARNFIPHFTENITVLFSSEFYVDTGQKYKFTEGFPFSRDIGGFLPGVAMRDIDINCGVMIMKESQWLYRMLDEAYNEKQNLNHPHWEQHAILEIKNRKPHIFLVHAKILPCWEMNSLDRKRSVEPNPCFWEEGDFIMHYAGGDRLNSIKYPIVAKKMGCTIIAPEHFHREHFLFEKNRLFPAKNKEFILPFFMIRDRVFFSWISFH